MLWCDGRRTVDLPPGARIEVRRGARPVRLVRLHEAPFTDRLVAKFDLPVEGWRGAASRAPAQRREAPMLEEIRISLPRRDRGLDARARPGLTVITGETGAGKTMVVTALGLLLGGRADTGAVRTGAKAARVEGVVRVARSTASPPPSRRPAARSRTTSWCWRARSRPRAAREPSSAAPRSRSRALAELADPLVAVHGQSDQHRLLQPAPSARRSTGSAGRRPPRPADALRRAYHELLATEAELAEVTRPARGAGPGGRPAPLRPRGDRGGRAAAG